MKLSPFVILEILGSIYSSVLRDILLTYVSKTPNVWDNKIVDILDMLLNYKQEK